MEEIMKRYRAAWKRGLSELNSEQLKRLVEHIEEGRPLLLSGRICEHDLGEGETWY